MAEDGSDTAAGMRIGYARCSTDKQDLRAQKNELSKIGVDTVYVDEGFTGTKRDSRHGLDQALAAVRGGDTLVVTKLDRLARSVPDALAIADDLEARGVRLQLGSTTYDPADPMGRMFFQMLAIFAEFEANLARMRTREGMAEARRAGKLRGKPPKFDAEKDRQVRRMADSGDYNVSEIASITGVARTTIYRSLDRTRTAHQEALARADSEQIPGQTSIPTPVEGDDPRDVTGNR